MAKTCAICGKPSGMYPLCKECFKLKDEGKVVKCEECNTWHLINKPCACTPKENNELQDNTILSFGHCIICGNHSNEFLFCKDCYGKHRHETFLLKIINCEASSYFCSMEKYEENIIVTTDDHHKVRSKSEMALDNYFFHNKIIHVYEPEIVTSTGEILTPDFYLPELDVYIEHWGLNDDAYLKRRQEKIDIYRNEGLTVIGTYESDIQNVNTSITKKLRTFKKGEINFCD